MKHINKNFLDRISIAKKSFLLLMITSFGLLFLGGLVHFGLYNIKSEIRQVYTQQLDKISALHHLQEHCNMDLQNQLHSYLSGKSDASHTILNFQQSALNLNQTYGILRQKDPASAQKLSGNIQALNQIFADAYKLLEKNEQHTFLQKLFPRFESLIMQCNTQCNHLIASNIDTIHAHEERIDEHYYGTLIATILLIITILALTSLLAFSIYTSVKKLIYGLSDIVAKKTKEYQELALQMEYKVNKEVVKSREKDQIMYQHARLAAMGEMIGNIAHQWRQPLNALTVLIQSFEMKSMQGTLTQEFIDKQVREGLRLANQMSSTIEDFKNFFSPHKEREYFGVVEAIEDTLELVDLFLKDEHIDIKLIAKEEIRVYGYINEFSQVILNLINNSRDNFRQKKIENDRRIIIRVERKTNPEPVAIISFIDNGGGIDEEIIDRIFEPYFTTKHKSTGTGIGLYMSSQIIEKQMHGLITVKNITSRMGTEQIYRCARFTIIIPLK